MKKIICLLLILSLSIITCATAFAYAIRVPVEKEVKGIAKNPDDIFFEDFTSYEEGSKPTTVTVKETAGNPVEVVLASTPDQAEKKVLKLTDTNGAPSVTINLPESDSPITLETRIKFIPTTTPGFGFIMDFKGQGATAFRLTKFSAANDSLCFVNSAGNNLFSRGADFKDQWFKIQVRIDPATRQTGVIMENENFGTIDLDILKATNVWQDKENKRVMAYAQQWYNEFTAPRVEQIILQAYGSATSGEYLIDYIKLTKNVPEFKPVKSRAESVEAEIITDPTARLVPNKVNLMFNNEVKYLAYPIELVSGRAMMDVKSFASLYELEVSKDGGNYELKGEKGVITFVENSTSFTSGGKSATADIAPQKIDNIMYIPVKSFATSLGNEVSWQDDPQCVIIK